MKSNLILTITFSLFITLVFYLSATFIENKYAYLYEDYYTTTLYENLTHLKEYSEIRNNYLTLGKELKSIGVKVISVEDGHTDKGHLVSSSESHQKKLYYINDDLYNIFDWDKRKITAKEGQQSIRQAIFTQYGNIPEGSGHSGKIISINDENRMYLRYFIIEPTTDDTFKFRED